MGQKRAIFGNLRLWSHARSLNEQEDRGSPAQVALGVDQDRALVIPASPNAHGGIEVVTWGGPGSVKTQAAWIAMKAAIRAALRARHEYGFPLVWVEDDTYDRVGRARLAPEVAVTALCGSRERVRASVHAGHGLVAVHAGLATAAG